MKTLKFKTNINCAGCVAKITPILNAKTEIEKWSVDTENVNKILTVHTSLSVNEVEESIKAIGFKVAEV